MDPYLGALLDAAPHGVLTLATANEHGFDRHLVQKYVDRRDLVRPSRATVVSASVWASADAERRHLLRSVGAALVCRTPVAVSHTGAGVLHGLPVLGGVPALAHLCRRDPGGGRRTLRYQLHESYGAGAATAGLPWVVLPVLAVFGVAELLGFVAGVAALDAALHRRLTSPPECEQWRRRLQHRPHTRVWDRVIRAADGRAESPLETQVRLMVVALGYRVTPQVRLPDATSAFVARVDLLIEELGVVIEVDGAVKYQREDGSGSPEAVLSEKRRESAITDLGYAVVRADHDSLRQPALFDRRIQDAAKRARRPLRTEPRDSRR